MRLIIAALGAAKTRVTALVLAALVLVCTPAPAQEHHHPPQDADAHETFYRHLKRPDIEGALPGSCCGKHDCYATPARYVNGQWQALRREDQVWIVVPEERVVTREEELALRPDHQAVLCALPTFTYCFVPPQSGT